MVDGPVIFQFHKSVPGRVQLFMELRIANF